MCVGAQRPDVLEAGACVRRCPEARLSLEAGLTYIGASKPPRHAARHLEATSTPKVDESGACLARRPRRTKMVTERYASMLCIERNRAPDSFRYKAWK